MHTTTNCRHGRTIPSDRCPTCVHEARLDEITYENTPNLNRDIVNLRAERVCAASVV